MYTCALPYNEKAKSVKGQKFQQIQKLTTLPLIHTEGILVNHLISDHEPAKVNIRSMGCVNGHRKQLRVTEYQQNCFLCLAFIDAR